MRVLSVIGSAAKMAKQEQSDIGPIKSGEV